MGAEYERKYRAEAATQEAVQAEYPGGWTQIAMQTTYYDTPGGSLSARRYTLRRRLENGVSICTLKTPAPNGARGEWETQCQEITEAIPLLCKLGCPDILPSLCAEGLIPLCGARFMRKTRLLKLPDCTVELALDTGILFGGGQELPLCEIELELKAGSREALDAFAEGFAAKYGLAAEEKSKFARALSLYKKEV